MCCSDTTRKPKRPSQLVASSVRFGSNPIRLECLSHAARRTSSRSTTCTCCGICTRTAGAPRRRTHLAQNIPIRWATPHASSSTRSTTPDSTRMPTRRTKRTGVGILRQIRHTRQSVPRVVTTPVGDCCGCGCNCTGHDPRVRRAPQQRCGADERPTRARILFSFLLWCHAVLCRHSWNGFFVPPSYA